jgi:hypothetical protein
LNIKESRFLLSISSFGHCAAFFREGSHQLKLHYALLGNYFRSVKFDFTELLAGGFLQFKDNLLCSFAKTLELESRGFKFFFFFQKVLDDGYEKYNYLIKRNDENDNKAKLIKYYCPFGPELN